MCNDSGSIGKYVPKFRIDFTQTDMLVQSFLVLGLGLLLAACNALLRNNIRQRSNFLNLGVKTPRALGPLHAEEGKEPKSRALVSRLLSSTRKKKAAAACETAQQPGDSISSSDGNRREWESMTVPELKSLLKSMKLKVSGTKKELLERLQESHFTSPIAVVDAEEKEMEEEQGGEDLLTSASTSNESQPLSSSPLSQIYASDMNAVIKSKVNELKLEAYGEEDKDAYGKLESFMEEGGESSVPPPPSPPSPSPIIASADDDNNDSDEEDVKSHGEEEDFVGGDPSKTNVFDFDDYDELESFMEEGGKYLDQTTLHEPIKEKRPLPPLRSPTPSSNRLGSGDDFRNGSQDEIQALVDKRTDARKSVDFATADKIKVQLEEEFGVEIFDTLGIWKSANGRTGRLASLDDLSDTPCTLSEKEVQVLVIQRTIARRNRNFDLADGKLLIISM